MDRKWLEDYIALVECGNFTKAAESRFVTQPAFSRRIKSLENWLGVELVDRNAYPATLTELGREYVDPIKNVLCNMDGLRAEMRSRANAEQQWVVSTQHSLDASYCPKWYSLIKPYLGERKLRINADNLHNCLDILLATSFFASVYPKRLNR